MTMRDPTAAREKISEARAAIRQAVKLDPGRRAIEGDIESADLRLDEAANALSRGEVAHAQATLSEAIELLRSEQSRAIAEDLDALRDAIGGLSGIDWG